MRNPIVRLVFFGCKMGVSRLWSECYNSQAFRLLKFYNIKIDLSRDSESHIENEPKEGGWNVAEAGRQATQFDFIHIPWTVQEWRKGQGGRGAHDWILYQEFLVLLVVFWRKALCQPVLVGRLVDAHVLNQVGPPANTGNRFRVAWFSLRMSADDQDIPKTTTRTMYLGHSIRDPLATQHAASP